MKKIFIRTVSVLMVVLMILTSAPLGGFVGMDWSRLDFGVKASAEDYIEIPDDLVDYSYLTTNQYMAKVILNSDYIGSANQYGKIYTNEKFKEYMYYLNPYKVSFAKTLCRALENNKQFSNNLVHWELLNFDPAQGTEKLLERKDYYIAILYNIIDQKMQDSEFLEALDCTTNETILSLSEGAASTLESLYQLEVERLDKIKTSDLSGAQIHELLNGMVKNNKVKKFYNKLGSNFDDIGVITKGCTTVYDIIKNVSMYSSLIDVVDSIKVVLAAVSECVPENNIVMKAAVQEVYKTCSEQITETTFTMIKAGEKIIDNVLSRAISSIWKKALGHISASIEFGRAIGKGISNFCFSSDATIEQYYALSCLTKFEDVIIDALIKLSVNFKNNESSDNADAFLMGIKMLLSVYSLGCDYSYTFADIVKNKGFVNFIRSFWEDDDTVDQYKLAVNDMKGVLNLSKRFLTCIDGYIAYYKLDAPIAYKAYFEPPADENTSSLNYAYSPNTNPFYVESLTDNNGNAAILSYIRESDNTITITNCNPSARGNIIIPNEICGVPVKKIAYRAFRDCDKIISVTFNNSLKIIENYAFQDCTSLNKVTLNDGLETIGGRAFANTALIDILIPKTVTTMWASAGDSTVCSALENVETLKRVTFEYGMIKIPKRALEDCSAVISISIPNSVTEIDINAFKRCTGLTKLTLPDSLRTIGEGAFSYCIGLSELTLPGSLRTIGEGAFSNCSNLIKISFNDGLETIGGRAFANTALTEVFIPKTVTTMYTGYLGSYRSAFEDVETLKSVTFENGMNEIPKGALCNCSSVVNVSIPNGVTRIGDRVFYNCNKLTSVTIPNSVTTIEGEAFSCCESLTNITIPNYVTTIDSFAFYNCTALTNVTIPNSVETIYNWAFSNCDSLENVYYGGTKEQWEQIEIELHNEPLISATIHFNLNGLGDVYTITYNANGGTGAPSSQTKTEGVNLNLSNTKPVKDGYVFRGWTTSLFATAAPEYQPGSIYTADADVTLYAVWKKEFYGDIYNDGVINDADVLYATQVVEGLKTASSYAVFLGDVNGDGRLTSNDVDLITQYNMKGIHRFPVENMHAAIEVYNMPYKTLYKPNDSIVTTGLQLAVLYYDSAVSSSYKSYHIINNGYTITSEKASGSGTQNITVNIGDLKTSYSITVDSEVPTKGSTSIYYDNADCTMLHITLRDNHSVDGYYWGTNSTIESNTFYDIIDTTSETIYKSISKEDSYYFAIKDTAGNFSYAYKFKFHKLTLDANGGNVEKDSYIVLNSDNITLPSATRSGYTFKGWSTSSTATKVEYTAGETNKVSSNVTLYAVWEANHLHSYSSIVINEATCAKTGSKKYTCSCGSSYTESIPKNASNHAYDIEIRNAKTATCKQEGYTGDTCCTRCSTKLKTGSTIAKTAHTYGSWTTIKAATCTVAGSRKKVCTGCSNTVTETVKALGHSFGSYKSDNNATYKADGTKTAKCTRCNATKTVADTGSRLIVKKPTTVTAAQNTSAIKLSWNACKGATGYRIYYKSGNTWKVCVSSTTATSHTFSNLKAGAKYTFAIRPYIIFNDEVIWSDYTQFTTATKPATVTAKTSSPSKGKISLTFGAVNGADGYQVYYKTGNGAYKLYNTYTKAGTLNFSNLKSGTKYTFAVRAGIKTSGGNIFGGYTPVTVTVK